MKEILSSIKDSARERIKNPLFGAFIFYWCVYNWEIILRIYAMEGNPNLVVSTLKPLLEDGWRYFWPLLSAVASVAIFPWITVGVQKWRNIPLLVSKKDKFDFELKQLREKENLITQEANNEGLKTKIAKEMELSLKEKEFDLDQKIKQSDLDTKLEEVEKEKYENAKKKEELDKHHKTLMDREKKVEEDEKQIAQTRSEQDKETQSLKDGQKELQDDKLDHIKRVQKFAYKKEVLEEPDVPTSLAAAITDAGAGDRLKKMQSGSKNKKNRLVEALKSQKSLD